jgi:hypothetical protein
MKTIKIFLGFCWFFSALLVGVGIGFYFGSPSPSFNYPLLYTCLVIFISTFAMLTPLILFTIFGDAVTKNQQELDDEKKRLQWSKKKYDEAKQQLVKAALQFDRS